MPEVEQSGSDEGWNIDPVYRPSDDGAIVVYAGDLQLAVGADERVLTGNLELGLGPRPEFSAHVAGSDPWLAAHAWDSHCMTVVLPAGVVVDPPTDRVPTARPEGAVPWAHVPIPINRMTTGELRLAERLLLHVSGPLSRWPLPSCETGSIEQAQPQLRWSLSGWDLRLAEAGGPKAVDDFSFVVEAIPHDLPLGLDATERLVDQVFLLLSLIAGQEIGVGPVVGVDAGGRVAWATGTLPASVLSSPRGGGVPGIRSIKRCSPSPPACRRWPMTGRSYRSSTAPAVTCWPPMVRRFSTSGFLSPARALSCWAGRSSSATSG
jgi:hypothetical protein